jgi:DNA-binding NtrC family response regulator
MAQLVRVLIVDDEPTLLRACRRALSRDFDVVTANGGAEAVALLLDDPSIAAVVCDLQMPGVDGLDVHAAIQEHRPELQDRTLWATGGATTPTGQAFLKRPDVRSIVKPYSGKTLRDAVAELLISSG